MAHPIAPLVIRGKTYTDNLVEIGARGEDLIFRTPDASKYIDKLPLGNPTRLADLYQLTFDEILDYIEALGKLLVLSKNEYLQEACELSCFTSPMTRNLVVEAYSKIGNTMERAYARRMAENDIGIDYLEGWVPQPRRPNGQQVAIRCFGARTLHIVAGNGPSISAISIVRNMLLRSDAIIKAPSNDPFTALAIARTMVGMAPDHPMTKHLSVGYWRGGDQNVEEKLYQPEAIEKIIAWGGFAAMKHIAQYIQPGLEVISLDPKLSASIVGADAFASEQEMDAAAVRLATDIGAKNQVGCVNARVAYVVSGTDRDGVAKANAFGKKVYDAMVKLPNSVSTNPKKYDVELKANVNSLRLDDEWYKVFGGDNDEGAVIVSQLPEPVPFHRILGDRTGNIVPVDTVDEEVLAAVNAYTQTVGIYPEKLKEELMDILPLHGAQRIVSLGYATVMNMMGPQDSIETMRRMGKWIFNETSDPKEVPPLWERPPLSAELENFGKQWETTDNVASRDVSAYLANELCR